MAVEILSGPITGPYLVDDGDIIVVSADAVVSNDVTNESTILTRSKSDDGLTVIVDGDVVGSTAFSGIKIAGNATDEFGDPAGFNLVQVRKGGFVSGELAILFEGGQYNSITVSGRVEGGYSGVWSDGDYLSVNVSGTVLGKQNAVELHGDFGVISNSGRLVSSGVGIFSLETNGNLISNTGKILGGISGNKNENLTLLNHGVIDGTENSNNGIQLYESDGLYLENDGRLEGRTAVFLDESTATIINSGKMIGDSIGLSLGYIGSYSDRTVTVLNTGLIKGAKSLSAQDGLVHLTNMGVMNGHIDMDDFAQTTLINGGKIIGTVKLGYLDDTYRAIDDGFVTRFVFGDYGQDKLTGSSGEDDLRGGYGDDILRGKGGADVLKGGHGDDVLKGGGKADILNGGAGQDLLRGGKGDDTLQGNGGKDVFVFGADSGTDSVLDFTDGADIMRLTAHSGGFDALTITDQGADLMITHDGGVILLTGEAGTVLTGLDFDFV